MTKPGLTYELRFDGGCWPNPGGPARYGWAVYVHDPEEHDAAVLIADGHNDVEVPPGVRTSNNVAEWCGLAAGLRWLSKLRVPVALVLIRGDSQLVIKQLTGEWKCKKPWLEAYRDVCRELLRRVEWEAGWIPREENAHCDALAGIRMPARLDAEAQV